MEYGYFSNQNIREVKMSVSESNIEISKQTQLAVESNIFLNYLENLSLPTDNAQINMYTSAVPHLGSTRYAKAVRAPHIHNGEEVASFEENTWKCNLFVCVTGHYSTGAYVPLVNITGIWPLQNLYPPHGKSVGRNRS